MLWSNAMVQILEWFCVFFLSAQQNPHCNNSDYCIDTNDMIVMLYLCISGNIVKAEGITSSLIHPNSGTLQNKISARVPALGAAIYYTPATER